MPARAINAKTVAEMLGIREATFRGKRRQLEESHGFPPKLPGCNAWSEPAIERWIATNGSTYQPAAPDEDIILDAATRLSSEFGRNAA